MPFNDAMNCVDGAIRSFLNGDLNMEEELIRFLYGCPWIDTFDEDYGEGAWERVYEAILPACINANRVYMPDPNGDVMWFDMYERDQEYRDMYMIYAALNFGEAYKQYFNPILYRQRTYDRPAFDRCLDSLDTYSRNRILNMMNIPPELYDTTAPAGDVTGTVIFPHGHSDLFTDEEIDAAIRAVLEEFPARYPGCRLDILGYAGDAENRRMQNYGATYEQFGPVNRIELISSMYCGPECPDDSLGQDALWDDWTFILILTQDGRWIIVDNGSGYGVTLEQAMSEGN